MGLETEMDEGFDSHLSHSSHSSETPRAAQAASRLVRELTRLKGRILERWEQAARSLLPAARKLESLVLRDSLPKFLDEMINHLEHKSLETAEPLLPSPIEIELAREHGAERTEENDYDLGQVIEEYVILRRIILDELRTSFSLSSDDYDAILDFVALGIKIATTEFARLKQERSRQASASLRESEERFRAVVEGLKDHAIIRTDADNTITYWNRGAENITGFSREEALGKKGSLIFVREDLDRGADREELKIAREKGRAEDTRWHVKKNGDLFFATGIVNPLRSASGDIVGYVKVLRDSTQAMRDQIALADSEIRYKLATQATRNIIWDWNLDTDEIIWNEALATELGYDQEARSSSGAWWKEHLHPDDRDRVFRSILSVIQSSASHFWSDEYRFQSADGSYRVFLDRGTVARDPQGQPLRMIGAMEDVTQERQATAALRESEERLTLATSSTGIGVWEVDVRARKTWRTPSDEPHLAEQKPMGGRELDSVFNQIHAVDRERVRQLFDTALDTGNAFAAEFRVRSNDDGIRWIVAQGQPLRNEAGEVVRLIGTTVDITSRKQAEEALRAAETEAQIERRRAELAMQELYDFFMQAPIALSMLHGSELRYALANPKFVEITGRNPVGLTIREVYLDQEIEKYLPLFNKVYSTGEPYIGRELPFRKKTADGQVEDLFINVGFHPFREHDGRIKGILAVVDDVTLQVMAQRSIEQSEYRFRQMAEAMPQLVWTADETGTLDYFNQKTYEYSGLSFDDLEGWKWKQIMDPEDIERTALAWRESIRTGKPYDIEYRVRRFDGVYRWHLVRAFPIRDEHGKIVRWFGTSTDIHDTKVLNEKLKAAQMAAESANATKSTFLANMSHEIRTPMTAVLGFTELLRDPELTESEREDAITRIESSGRSLLRVIDDILDISKIEAGKLTIQKSTFSPVSVASEVVSILRLVAEQKGITLRLRSEPSVPATAFSDPARLRQILVNLVGNAVKFTSRGEVVLCIKAHPPSSLVFEVTDTGIGIAESDQAKLFQPFAQADESITRKFGGTGLGLLLSRRLAEQLEGKLDLVESQPEQGSRFAVTLDAGPFTFNEEAQWQRVQPQPKVEAGQGKALSGVRILLAEDVVDNQVLMQRYLASAGATLQIANNGEEAIALACHGVDAVDVVLMDIQMPKLDGIQATRRLREAGFKMPILALTAHAMPEEVARSIEAGCTAHLTKPISKDALIKAVHGALKVNSELH